MRPLAAMQATLAAEHAAVHVYAVLGGRVSSVEAPLTAETFQRAYDAHRARRDQLRASIADLGAEPVPAAAAYRVDADTRDTGRLVQVARTTEQRCAAHYAQLVASTTGGQRRWGAAALTDAAVRLLGLGGAAEAFPGLDEL